MSYPPLAIRTYVLNLTEIFAYPHSSLGDTQDYSPVLYSRTAHASICCRMLFHSRCTPGHDRTGSLRNTHSELHGRWKSYTLQMMDNARQGMGWGLRNKMIFNRRVTPETVTVSFLTTTVKSGCIAIHWPTGSRHRIITTIIIHSKYFPISNWLKPHA